MGYFFIVLSIGINWLVFSFLFLPFFDNNAWIPATVVTIALIALAISPANEWLTSMSLGARKATKQEYERIMDAVSEIVNASGEGINPEKLKEFKNPKIYVSDQKYANAFAFGKNSICVTKGLLEQSSPDELRGVISHEAGHLYYKDSIKKSIVTTLNYAGNVSSVLIMIGIFIFNLFENTFSKGFSLGKVLLFVVLFYKLIYWLLQKIIDYGYLAVGRSAEYRADNFAKKLGYGEGLISFLKRIDAGNPAPKGIMASLSSTHPPTSLRIERLQRELKAS